MSSISLTIKQQWAGCLVVYPWSRAQIGVRRKGGGLRYVPFGGLPARCLNSGRDLLAASV
ncbi:MAG: hypothetical protein CL538_05430 [Alcanivorax sp.]|nr:hypothetical protein [Alcanivorax sp.]|tara:strand:+ start:1322 stop:1501 length:180 start_codon:yes stop_codon:yes gene_type:complete